MIENKKSPEMDMEEAYKSSNITQQLFSLAIPIFRKIP